MTRHEAIEKAATKFVEAWDSNEHVDWERPLDDLRAALELPAAEPDPALADQRVKWLERAVWILADCPVDVKMLELILNGPKGKESDDE